MGDESKSRSSRENLSKGRSAEQELQSSLERIGLALRGLKFGNVNVIVQDGVVIQIDRTEKQRFRNSLRSED